MYRKQVWSLLSAAVTFVASATTAWSQDTLITYQGLLKDSGSSLTGQVDLEFSLFDSDSLGLQIGSTLSASNVDVVGGLFTVDLDFGASALNGGDRWLEIAIANPAGGSFTTLSPRQPLTASPYAIQTRGIAVDDVGNVGINTDTPLRPLHVEGSARAGSFHVNNPNNDGASAHLSWLNDTARIRIGGSGPGANGGFSIQRIGDQTLLRLTDNKLVGIVEDDPLVRLHVTGESNGLLSSALENDEIVVEAQDAVMGLYSTSQGTWGSAITLKEVSGGGIVDTWGIARHTTSGGSELFYTYGPSDNYSNNASMMMLSADGEVGIGTTDPHATLHVASDDFLGVKITQTNDNDYARLMLDGNGQHLVQLNVGAPGTSLPGTFNIYRPGIGNMLSIAPDGDVGIGTSTPGEKLDVRGDVDIIDSRPELTLSNSADGEGITIEYRENLDELRIQNRTNFGNTYESQIAVFQADGNVGIGTGSPSSKLEVNGRTTTDELEITGGSDLSEQFDIDAAGAEVQPGMVVRIDPSNPGKLAVSTRQYDPTVAGVVSGAGGVKPGMLMGQDGTLADGEHPVALTGRVYVRATASNGAILPGDMLTTSSTAGYAMKATDRQLAFGATIGKAMTVLESGEGLVLVLVSLQ